MQSGQVADSLVTLGSNLVSQSGSMSNLLPQSGGFSFDFVRLVRGMLGMVVLIGLAWLFSSNRKAVNWTMVGRGLGFQVLLAVGVLYVPFIQEFFEIVGGLFVKILQFTQDGVTYLLKRNDTKQVDVALRNFAFTILPTIIFFSALSSLLFYLGIIQVFVRGFGYLLSRLLGLSGPESLSVAGNIFLGQTESPLLVKPYLEKMTKSEILLVMSGGMATLAGGVLAAYIGFLGGGDPVQQIIFAKHLLTASIMAAPGVVVISKIIVPETESFDRKLEVSRAEVGKNVLDAVSNGTTDGLRLAVNVGAMLLVFVAFIAMFNFILFKVGDWTSLNGCILTWTGGKYDELSLEFLLGYALSPLMWLIGVGTEDISLVGSLLGKKLIMTEFIAYTDLAEMKAAGLFAHPKSIIMSVYMLCGFANFASVGIQIGGIGAIAPGRRVLLARFGMRALLAGSLASLLSATIIGVLLG
ncbi:MAG: Na+ dependent nucleoside transporter [Bacteroidetes bacterium]|nr:MAG: Na+ dependent nucleoside transporter [Bacteroidota bacterium]